jgi:hypothetical protein
MNHKHFIAIQESYKYNPSDIEVISCSAVTILNTENLKTLLNFFGKASAIAPNESRYPLLVALCYSSIDCKQEALDVYERVLHDGNWFK